MEEYLKKEGTAYLGGQDRPGLLDYNAWPWMHRMIVFSDKYLDGKQILSKFALVAKWVELMRKDGAVAEYAIPEDTMVAYMKRAKEGDPDRYDMLMTV